MNPIRFNPAFPEYRNYSIEFHTKISMGIEYKVCKPLGGHSNVHFSGVIKDEF